jgi:hypothetical protein
MKYKTIVEAQKVADMENLGRDYGTAVVVKEGDYFIIKII